MNRMLDCRVLLHRHEFLTVCGDWCLHLWCLKARW